MNKRERLKFFEAQAFPDTFFKQAQSEFREYYNSELSNLQAAEKAFRNLIVLLLKGKEFPEPKVVSRVKDRSECVRKFDRKYRNQVEEFNSTYSIKDYVSDLIGVRVICIYESDIDMVAEVLREHFDLIEETDKSKELESTVSSFGYKGLHLDLKLKGPRSGLPEYETFQDLKFEVQIRTIVQDAWSEVDHKLKYKKQTPLELQRRIAGLAALFEIADREFEVIRDVSMSLEAEAKDTRTKIDEEKSLDLVGFLRVVNEYFPAFPMGGDPLDTLLTDIASSERKLTTANLRNALSENLDRIQSYRSYLKTMGHSMTPYTQIRHALFDFDVDAFGKLIFDGHRRNYERWKEHGTVHPSEIV